MSLSTFAQRDGGGRLLLPFNLDPRHSGKLAEDAMKVNVQFLLIAVIGAENALWTGYYASLKGIKVAIEKCEGIWFEVRYDQLLRKYLCVRSSTTRVKSRARTGRNFEIMNLPELRFQTL